MPSPIPSLADAYGVALSVKCVAVFSHPVLQSGWVPRVVCVGAVKADTSSWCWHPRAGHIASRFASRITVSTREPLTRNDEYRHRGIILQAKCGVWGASSHLPQGSALQLIGPVKAKQEDRHLACPSHRPRICPRPSLCPYPTT